MAWNGYRASKVAGGGLYNGYVTPKAKQPWAIGMRVNVGFLKGLLITNKVDGIWKLVNETTGARYEFQPHLGISRV